MAHLGFNANKVEPSAPMELLPDGDYFVVITDGEERQTKAGDGSYLMLTFEVVEGNHRGRKLWHNFNLSNPSAKAVKIAQEQLSAVCHAVGVLEPDDSEELHDIPLAVRVKTKRDKNYGDKNEITGFLSVKDPKVKKPQAPTAKPTNGAPAPKPWDKKPAYKYDKDNLPPATAPARGDAHEGEELPF